MGGIAVFFNFKLLYVFLLIPSLLFAGTLRVPKDYKTIQEAIDKAKSGETVIVAAGRYIETISLKPGVKVISEGSEKEHKKLTAAKRTIISSPGHKLFVVKGNNNALLDGFSIEDNIGGLERSSSGVLIEGTSQSIINCIIRKLPYDGITISGTYQSSKAYIYNNFISKNYGNGIKCEKGASAHITHNMIYKNERSGIENNAIKEIHILDNKIYGNDVDGIMNSGARAIIKDNDIFKNGLNGIGLQLGSNAKIIKNKIHENAQTGIGMRTNSTAEVVENLIYENNIGIGCLDLASVEIKSNEIYKNLRIGIGLIGCKGKVVKVIDNYIHDNGFFPISPNFGCKLTKSGNRF